MTHDLGIYRHDKQDDCTLLHIDIDQAKYFGVPLRQLGAYGRRKFENVLVIKFDRERLRLIYKP